MKKNSGRPQIRCATTWTQPSTNTVIEELIVIAKGMRKANLRGEKLNLSDDEVAFHSFGTGRIAVCRLGSTDQMITRVFFEISS